MPETVIETEGLTKRYGAFTAVDQLDLTIQEGEIFGLLGPNGAGKTTTILMLLGLTEPTAGRVRVCGLDPARRPLEVKRVTGYLPDNVGFYDELTGWENLFYTADLNGIPRREAAERIAGLLRRVGLEASGHRPVGTYSRGMRQRLGLADVLLKQPRVVILDEPTLGIDPEGVQEMLDLIARLSQEERVAVLLSSHHLHQVQQICHRVGIFVRGRMLACGRVADLAGQIMAGEPVRVELECDPAGPAVADALGRIPGVQAVAPHGAGWLVTCTGDLRADIARCVQAQGSLVTHLRLQGYSLDEIYRRYFQGVSADVAAVAGAGS